MPLPLTRKEQKMLATVLLLLVLGLLGRALWGTGGDDDARGEGLTGPVSAAPAQSAP